MIPEFSDVPYSALHRFEAAGASAAGFVAACRADGVVGGEPVIAAMTGAASRLQRSPLGWCCCWQ
jgi:hypothetical protein